MLGFKARTLGYLSWAIVTLGCHATNNPDGGVPPLDVDDTPVGGARASGGKGGGDARAAGGKGGAHVGGHPASDEDAGTPEVSGQRGEPDCSTSACKHGGSCLEPSRITCDCPDPSAIPPCGEVRFRSLGILPDSNQAAVTALSDDGTTVVGTDFSHALRWTLQDGLEAIPFPGEMPSALRIATAVSADGKVICGYATPLGFEAGFCWREGVLTYLLQSDDLRPWLEIYDLSAAGDVLIGVFVDEPGNAFRWTQSTGLVELPPLPGDAISNAFALSGDGQVAAGMSGEDIDPSPDTAGYIYRPVVWRQGMMAERLPVLPDSTDLQPTAADADGSVIVGYGAVHPPSSRVSTSAAVRWSSAGVEFLSTRSAAALGVSPDGSVIVGKQEGQAVVWVQGAEAQSIALLLTEAGEDLSGWRLTETRDVAADGKTIAGIAMFEGREHAFVAWLP